MRLSVCLSVGHVCLCVCVSVFSCVCVSVFMRLSVCLSVCRSRVFMCSCVCVLMRLCVCVSLCPVCLSAYPPVSTCLSVRVYIRDRVCVRVRVRLICAA